MFGSYLLSLGMGMLTQTLEFPQRNNRKEPNLKHKPNNNNKTTTAHNNKTGRNQMITKQEIKNPTDKRMRVKQETSQGQQAEHPTNTNSSPKAPKNQQGGSWVPLVLWPREKKNPTAARNSFAKFTPKQPAWLGPGGDPTTWLGFRHQRHK